MTDIQELPLASTSPITEALVTSKLFEAYLACPTKCFLLASGEFALGNDFTIWSGEWRDSYLHAGLQRLIDDHSHAVEIELQPTSHWKRAKWHFAISQIIRIQNFEARPHALQRIPFEGPNKPAQYIPIRFIPTNKLSPSDKLVAGFEAYALAKAVGAKIGNAKIIHGDKSTTYTVKTSTLSRRVNKTIGQVASLLAATSPPDLVLNKHCPECLFQSRCRKLAVEKGDLSLLVNMPPKERLRLNGKGIFTVSQLSYTFRPRRRSKRLAAKPERYHHSLKALSIREKKIHVVGDPKLSIDGTAVCFDVEGLPDKDFYYLIGVRVEGTKGITHHSFWADNVADEERVWRAFLEIICGIDRPILIHYGSYETTFLKRMCDKYGAPTVDSIAAKAISSSLNILSFIFAQIYFPTYSNGLKEIAQFLGYKWSDPSSSGLKSIVWRHNWEASGDPKVRELLITYNTDDCDALALVVQTIVQISYPNNDTCSESGIVRAESLGRNIVSKLHPFKSQIADLNLINSAARWSYQRDRVFVRTGIEKRKAKKRAWLRVPNRKAQISIVLKPPLSCPKCGKRGRNKARLLSRTVQDLVFGRGSVKGRTVNYIFQTYRCRSCGHEYNVHDWYLQNGRKWGWNILAYFIYHIAGLCIPQGTLEKSINMLYGSNVSRGTLYNFKSAASEYYSETKRLILDRIINGKVIHADETQANIKGKLAYVWVLTNLSEVVYILVESREGEFIKTILKDFKGVLVSDFYAVYDTISCAQQKCLIHLMRDLNDEILNNPFDEEMKSITMMFACLLRSIVDSIDRRGLKKYFMRKHQIEVDRFYRALDATDYKSDVAIKCKQRFVKNREKLFTFLHYDGVPWNNNNAEHAIKAFARLRDVIGGSSTKSGLEKYLTLLTVAQTCEYRELDFLDFLRSREKDIDTFAQGRRRYSTKSAAASRVKRPDNVGIIDVC